MEERKGVYRLPQAGIISQDQLVEVLEPFGYLPMLVTSLLLHNKVCTISFMLVIDDLGLKYTRENNPKHLLNALLSKYKVKTYREGKLHVRINLKRDYNNGKVDLSMPVYVEAG